MMESRVKFRSPQNIPGASQQNSVVAFSAEGDGDWFKNLNQDEKETYIDSYSLSSVIQVSGSPEIPDWFERWLFFIRSLLWLALCMKWVHEPERLLINHE